jgi:hypothetical protein
MYGGSRVQIAGEELDVRTARLKHMQLVLVGTSQ